MAYTSYTPYDYTQNYDNIAKARKAALDAAYSAQTQQLTAQKPQLDQQYQNLRSQTYANARLSSIGNNEALAANGLAGNLYSNPTSGYSETSRIADNNALRSALSSANQQQQNAYDTIDNQIAQAGLTRDQTYQSQLADLEAQKLSAAQNENQYAANYNLQVQQANDSAAQQERANALNELQYFGKIISQKAADALGVPVGTTYSSMQAKSSGGSGGSQASNQASNLENIIAEFFNKYPAAQNNNSYYDGITAGRNRVTDTQPTNNIAWNKARNL